MSNRAIVLSLAMTVAAANGDPVGPVRAPLPPGCLEGASRCGQAASDRPGRFARFSWDVEAAYELAEALRGPLNAADRAAGLDGLAVRMQTDAARAVAGLGFLEAGDLNEAMHRVNAVATESALANFVRSAVHWNRGDWELARQQYRTAADLARPGSPVSVRIAELAVGMDPSAARATATSAISAAFRSEDSQLLGRAILVLSQGAGATSFAARSSLADRASHYSIAAGDPRGRYLTARLRRLSADATACTGLMRSFPALGADCLLSAAQEDVLEGRLAMARDRLDALGGTIAQLDRPSLNLRFALVAAPVLAMFEDPALLRLLDAGIAESRQLGDADVMASLHAQRIAAYRRQDRLAEAEVALAEARAGSPETLGKASLILEEARLRLAQGRPVEAAITFAAFESEAGYGEVERLASRLIANEHGLATNGTAVMVPSDLAGPFRTLTAAVLRGSRSSTNRARLLTRAARELRSRASGFASPSDPAAVAMWLDLAHRAAIESITVGEIEAALEVLEAYATEGTQRAPRVGHFRRHLDPGEAVLRYQELGERTVAFRIDRSSTLALELPIGSSELAGMARLWAAGATEDWRGWRALGGRLSEAILLPLAREGWLEGIRSLAVVLPPSLRAVGFDALPWPAEPSGSGGFLGDRIAIAQTQSLDSLDVAWHHRPTRKGRTAFLPKPSVDVMREARHVAGLPDAEVKLGTLATEEAFRRAAETSGWIHFGGHSASVRDEHGGGLQLRASQGYDGVLMPDEIRQLPLAGTHVVLLGCETAASASSVPIDALGWSTSLADEFIRAGGRSVVGNLWLLDDEMAATIASELYRDRGRRWSAEHVTIAKRRLRARFPDRPSLWAGLVWQGPFR